MRTTSGLVALAILLISCRCQDEATVQESAEVQELKKAGAEYLKRVMTRLQSERYEEQPLELSEINDLMDSEWSPEMAHGPSNYVTMPSSNKSEHSIATGIQAEIIPSSSISVPNLPPGLTAEELTAIYNAAVTKVANLPDIHTPVHVTSNLHHPPPPEPVEGEVIKPAAQGPAGNFLPGYYYYYYPIKSFLKTYTPPTQAQHHPPITTSTTTTTPRPVVMHATIHMSDNANKSVEPLFMAISGFIGMALMFAISVLFVPKFGKIRSGEWNAKDKQQDLIALGRVVFDSLEGKDCAERLACELGRILRGVRMDNKPLRVLEIVLPPKMGKQVALVRKAAAKKKKCQEIPCKFKKSETKVKVKPKPWKKVSLPHDLWMKHFENRTRFKQPENIWEKHRGQ